VAAVRAWAITGSISGEAEFVQSANHHNDVHDSGVVDNDQRWAGSIKEVEVGDCTYPTYEAVVVNVFNDAVMQKVVRYVHEKSGLTLKTRVYGVAGGQEREIGSGDAVSLR